MRKLVKVYPEVITNSDGSHSHYVYPNEFFQGTLKVDVVAYNRKLEDFFKEQMWLVSGPEEQIAELLKRPDVVLIESYEEAEAINKEWDIPTVVLNDIQKVINAVNEMDNDGILLPPALDKGNDASGIVERVLNFADKVRRGDVDYKT